MLYSHTYNIPAGELIEECVTGVSFCHVYTFDREIRLVLMNFRRPLSPKFVIYARIEVHHNNLTMQSPMKIESRYINLSKLEWTSQCWDLDLPIN